MPIQWNTLDDTLWLKGEQIGKVSKPDAEGKVTVTLSFSYRCDSDGVSGQAAPHGRPDR